MKSAILSICQRLSVKDMFKKYQFMAEFWAFYLDAIYWPLFYVRVTQNDILQIFHYTINQ